MYYVDLLKGYSNKGYPVQRDVHQRFLIFWRAPPHLALNHGFKRRQSVTWHKSIIQRSLTSNSLDLVTLGFEP